MIQALKDKCSKWSEAKAKGDVSAEGLSWEVGEVRMQKKGNV